MPPEHPFARDFGYLEPFLLKVREYARELANPEAAARLQSLMDEELDRWKEIRALLENAAPAGSAARPAETASARAASLPQVGKPRPWTVGSLICPP